MAIGNTCHSQGVVRFVCAQAGCLACLETLLRENKGLIQSVIQKQVIRGIDYADLVQEGRIGLWLAILHYDPAQGYAFSTYAWTVIRYRLWRAKFYADRVKDELKRSSWFGLTNSSKTQPTIYLKEHNVP